MRLNLAVAILISLAVGWAVTARADAPPAAPIFYCPTPGKAAPPAPSGPVAPAGHHHRHAGCPTVRAAAEHHHWRGHGQAPAVVANNDLSASQAFIYRYERAVHGLDARAAHQAWAEGGGAQPPCPHGCPGAGAGRHAPPGPALAQQAAPPPMAQQRSSQGPPPMAQPSPPPPAQPAPPANRGYAWSDGQNGYSYRSSERAGGWGYSEQDGRGHYWQWGDQFGDHPDHWDGPPRCPPPVPATACTAGQPAPAPAYRVAGRDAAGYLTWPGKTPAW